MQQKAGTLRSDYYGRLFIAARCAALIDAGEFSGEGPVRLQVEVSRYPYWDDLVEVYRSQGLTETVHGWQVKNQRTGLDKGAMLELLRALADSRLDRGHLALHSLEEVKKVGPLHALAKLCERMRQPNVDLRTVLESMSAHQWKWVGFARKGLKLSDDEACLRLFQRLSVEQVGTEEHLSMDALKDLRRWYEDPRAVLTKILGFLEKHPDEAVIIDYPLLRDTVLQGHIPGLRRGQTFTTLRERYLQALVREHEQLPLLKSLISLQGIRLVDVFVPPALQLDRSSGQALEEEAGEHSSVEQEESRSRNWRWEQIRRQERARAVPSNAVDLLDWLRTPDGMQSKTVLIEGAVGAGKSMMLEHLRYTLAQEALRTSDAPLPILVDAPDLATGDWSDAFRRKAPGVDDEQLLHQEGQSRIYLVDGLDEVPLRDKQRVSSLLDRLRTQPEAMALVLAGRPTSSEFPVPMATPRLRLAPWTEHDIERFLEKWRQKAPKQIEALGSSWRHEPMKSVLSNPLTATFSLLLAEEHPESRRSRTALFGGICEKLFQEWSQARSLRGEVAPPSWGDVSSVLQTLALEVISASKETIRKQELEKQLRKINPERNREWMDAASVRFGLLVRQGQDSYRFVLRGLAEFLAGHALYREGPQRIIKVARERWAEEPVRHAISIAAERGEPADALNLIAQLIPTGKPLHDGSYEVLGDIRTTFIAARAAVDLGAAAQPIATRLSEHLLHYVTLPVSNWIPARAAAEIRMLAHVESPCWDALFPRLKERLEERSDLAKWFMSQPVDKGWRWWLTSLRIADAGARAVITARLARWVDEKSVREALVYQLFDEAGMRPREASAPTEAGLALRQATRDRHFERWIRPHLVFALQANDQLASGGAALALKPGEANPHLLVKALRTLAKGYGCPTEVLDELAAFPEGHAALDSGCKDWSTSAETSEFQRLTPFSNEPVSKHMPLPHTSRPHVLRAMGPALARMSQEERRALSFEDGMAVIATLAEEAIDHPEGILSVLAGAQEGDVFFSINSQLVLQEAVTRNPQVAHALLAMWEHYRLCDDAYTYPGIALDGLVAAGDTDAAQVFVAWLEKATSSFFSSPSPALPLSAKALRHPLVKPVAHKLAHDLLKQHTEKRLDDEGRPTRLWIGNLASGLETLHAAWDGDSELEAELVESAIGHDDYSFSHVLKVFQKPPYPVPFRESLMERLRRQLQNPDDENGQFLPAWLRWAEQAGEIPGLRSQLEACARSESWLRYNAAARLLPFSNPEESRALSASAAEMWPHYWSPMLNSLSDLLRLAAANPQSWYKHLKIKLDEYEFQLAVRDTPVFRLARTLLPRLSPEDRGSLIAQRARTLGKYEQPWIGSSFRGDTPWRPTDTFLELCFDSGVQP
jgi:hypothetical protein